MAERGCRIVPPQDAHRIRRQQPHPKSENGDRERKKVTAARLQLTADAQGRILGDYTFSDADPLDDYRLSIPNYKGSARGTLAKGRTGRKAKKGTAERRKRRRKRKAKKEGEKERRKRGQRKGEKEGEKEEGEKGDSVL